MSLIHESYSASISGLGRRGSVSLLHGPCKRAVCNKTKEITQGTGAAAWGAASKVAVVRWKAILDGCRGSATKVDCECLRQPLRQQEQV